MTDREWGLLAPFMPSPRPVGRPRETDLRTVTNAILSLVSTGCQSRLLPKDFPISHQFDRGMVFRSEPQLRLAVGRVGAKTHLPQTERAHEERAQGRIEMRRPQRVGPIAVGEIGEPGRHDGLRGAEAGV